MFCVIKKKKGDQQAPVFTLIQKKEANKFCKRKGGFPFFVGWCLYSIYSEYRLAIRGNQADSSCQDLGNLICFTLEQATCNKKRQIKQKLDWKNIWAILGSGFQGRVIMAALEKRNKTLSGINKNKSRLLIWKR